MNRNPESESGIRIPNQNQNLKEERFSLFSIQSNPMQCNPTAAARMIFGAAAWTREREFTDFSEKADRENGGRSCAPFFYLEDSGSGAEKNCRMPSVCRGRDPVFYHGEAAAEKNIGKEDVYKRQTLHCVCASEKINRTRKHHHTAFASVKRKTA